MRVPERLTTLVRRTEARAALIGVLVVLVAATALFVRFARQVDALRVRHRSGPSSSLPSRVYSDGVPLQVGAILPPAALQAQLEARGYRPDPTQLDRPGTYAVTGNGFEIFLRGFSEAHDPAGFGG